jgi:hypothetical protein
MRPMNAGRSLSRRRLLRGAGVAMALPWLESVPVWGATGKTFPRRFAVLFMGNGINANHWWAKPATAPGGQMQLGKSLSPMEPLKRKMNFVSGLFNKPSVGVGIHPGMTGGILSGAPLQKGSVLKAGVSVDQVLAERLGQETVQPSLVLGCEQPNTGFHETNYSMAYSSHISWQSESSPVPLEVYPALAFDSLFENRGGKRLRSILDAVKEEAGQLHRQVAVSDRSKLDEYLTSVREVEKRVDPLRVAPVRAEAATAMGRPPAGLPQDLREHMKLMCDVVALAFQTDRTRVASLLLCRDLSGLFYPFLDVRDAHHPASHRDLSDDYEKISRYYCGQLAYLATRLDGMAEGDGTVLDHSVLLFLSNMWAGWRHDNNRLPVLTVGGLGGSLQTGRVLEYYDKPDDQRKLCSLYLSLMDRLGVPLDRFGDARTRLAGL